MLHNPLYAEISQRLLLALMIGGAIGLERSYHGRPAGFRTHALVCLSTSLLMLVSVYEGLWFTPLKSALDAFVAETQKTVTGTVRLKLYKGNSTVVGRKAPNALYSEDLATYDPNSTFDEAAAAGFIALWGLSARQWASVNGGT